MKKLVMLFSALFSISSLSAQKSLILTTPEVDVEYQVTSVSPNGKWACGNINETSNRGFIWNLETGEIRELSAQGYISMGLAVANDGTVAGTFEDPEALPNGATIEVAGYWRDGSWHHIKGSTQDKPTNQTQGSIAYCISPNGKLLAGATYINGHYTPVVWNIENGIQTEYKMYLSAKDYGHGSIYSVTDDGKACGWVTHPAKLNRTPCIWTSANDTIMPSYTDIGPFSTASSISSDGTKVLVSGGIYDLTTKKFKSAVTFDDVYAYDLYKINNDGVIGGYTQQNEESRDAVIIRNGKIQTLSDYLTSKGVDTSKYSSFLYTASFSDDLSAIAAIAYDTLGQARSIVIKTDLPDEKAVPNNLSAKALIGAGAIEVTWTAPLSASGAPESYVVLRNGTQVYSGSDLMFTDSNLADGTYSYTVKAVYADGESAATEAVSAKLTSTVDLQAPRDLQAVQRGYNNVQIAWEKPLSVQSTYDYMYDNAEIKSLGGGAYSFEAGVRLTSATLAAYANHGKVLSGVSFYPMSAIQGWKINLYDAADPDHAVYSQSVDPSSLVIGQANEVKLTTPYTLPTDKDLIIAVEADVDEEQYNYSVIGFTYGVAKPGYTDLMHRVNLSDEDSESFYSMQEYAVNSEEGAYMFQVTWPITAVFASADGSDDEVQGYAVYVNNKQQSTVSTLDTRLTNLTDGTHKIGVAAIYKNNKQSDLVSVFAKVSHDNSVLKPYDVQVSVNNGNEMTATWPDMSVDNNRTILCFASDNNTGGVTGSASAGYGYMVETVYSGDDIRTYDGYQISAFRFFPLATADFTFILKQDGEQVAEIEAEDYTVNQWNEIYLDTPLTLNRGSEYELIIDCYDVESGKAPIGMDDQWARQGVTDLYSSDNGETFSSLVNDGGKNANWMMGLVLNTTESTTSPVKGYNVIVDGKQANEELLTTTSFSKTYDVSGTHTLRVRAITDESYASSSVKYFTIDVSGISNITADSPIQVAHGATTLVVNGGAVKALKLYDTAGRQAAKSASDTIGISTLPAGTYVLSIELTDGTKFSQKVAL